MALLINEDCVICGACEPECPNTAIYSPGSTWTFAEGTVLKEVELESGQTISADHEFDHIRIPGYDGDNLYYIVPSKCTECTGFHEEPACALVCPTDACVPDPDYEESTEELLAKKVWLHGE